MSVDVSVVVPTYNRPDLLHNCLDRLLRQDFDPSAFEIVVVDNQGSQETRRLVESLSGKGQRRRAGSTANVYPAVYYVEEVERPGPAAARNRGWAFAHGDIVAFTDDDCLPERKWLAAGVRKLREGYDAVTGQVIVPIRGTPSDYEKNISRLEKAEFVTANCFLRCHTLQAIGGLDEHFTAAWREDSDLHFKLLLSGLKLGHAPGARVIHPVRRSSWGVSLKEQHKSMFNALLFKKYPGLYRERIQRAPPIRYYAIVLSVVGFLVCMMAGWQALALLMGLSWTALTAQFILERLRGTRHDIRHVSEMVITSILIPPLSIYWRLAGAVKYRVWFL